MNLKPILLTLLLCMATLTAVVAQDKYEYATVSQLGAEMRISIEGKPYEVEILKDLKHTGDHNKLFEYISKMQAEGWEVYNTLAPEGSTLIFVLRKKKN